MLSSVLEGVPSVTWARTKTGSPPKRLLISGMSISVALSVDSFCGGSGVVVLGGNTVAARPVDRGSSVVCGAAGAGAAAEEGGGEEASGVGGEGGGVEVRPKGFVCPKGVDRSIALLVDGSEAAVDCSAPPPETTRPVVLPAGASKCGALLEGCWLLPAEELVGPAVLVALEVVWRGPLLVAELIGLAELLFAGLVA